jgi:endonuclease YncB( thermonuclease family)
MNINRACQALAAASAILFLLGVTLARGETISGRAFVIDGDSIRVDGRDVRLYGIDAPERQQWCDVVVTRWYFFNDLERWPCGNEAEWALIRIVGTSRVTCERIDTDIYGRFIGRCIIALKEKPAPALDLAEIMARDGWAVAYTRYAHLRPELAEIYSKAAAAARAAKRGIWAGPFMEPEQWRRENRR